MSFLNIITSLLAFSDAVPSDNPQLRSIDWTRKLSQLLVSNPKSDHRVLAPNESYAIFDGTRTTSLSGASTLAIALLSGTTNRYRVSVTSGPAGFRVARAISGVNAVVVTVNNGAVATFSFTAATLTGVVVGDIMRISGAALYDAGPFVFNSLNAGLWKVIAVSGVAVQVTRLAGADFSGTVESVTAASTDAEFYSADGVQDGDKIDVTGTFSIATQRVYEVSNVTPDSFDVVSGLPLPNESGLTYISGTLTLYASSKKLVYVEVDQDASIRFNADVTDNTKLTPIKAADPTQPGYLHKMGDSYKVVVTNKSVNSLNVTFFTAE